MLLFRWHTNTQETISFHGGDAHILYIKRIETSVTVIVAMVLIRRNESLNLMHLLPLLHVHSRGGE